MSAQLSEFLQTGEDSAVGVAGGTSGSYAEIDLAENVSLALDHDKKEVKPRRSTRKGWKANLIGLNDFSGSMVVYVPAPGATGSSVDAYNVIRTAALNRQPVDLLFALGASLASTTTVPAIRAVCGIGFNREESGDDPVQETYNFHAVPNNVQDAPQLGTVTNGVFTPDEE